MQRSTVIFALATCVPFGLAIRDTIGGPPDELELATERLRMLRESHEAELASERDRARVEEPERAAPREATLHDVFGDEPASLGTVFGKAEIGGSVFDPDLARVRVDPQVRELGITVDILTSGGDTVDGVTIDALGARCSELAEHLQQRWGHADDVHHHQLWMTGNQRAVYVEHSADSCGLVFQRTAKLADWLSDTRASLVPMWAVGQSERELLQTLGDRAHHPRGSITWSAPGIGVDEGVTRLEATVQDDIVTGVTATFTTDNATRDALIARMREVAAGRDVRLDAATEPYHLVIGRRP